MLMRLARSVREYKTASILTLLFILFEAIIETFIPFITSEMIAYVIMAAACVLSVVMLITGLVKNNKVR